LRMHKIYSDDTIRFKPHIDRLKTIGRRPATQVDEGHIFGVSLGVSSMYAPERRVRRSLCIANVPSFEEGI